MRQCSDEGVGCFKKRTLQKQGAAVLKMKHFSGARTSNLLFENRKICVSSTFSMLRRRGRGSKKEEAIKNWEKLVNVMSLCLGTL